MTFDTTLAQWYRDLPEFQNVNADYTPIGPPQADPYLLINLDEALGARLPNNVNLVGSGEVVAIVDGGILQTHQEFDLPIQTYGTVPIDDHGTMVASIVAAAYNSVGIIGVAPGAWIHFTSYAPNGTFDLANITAGTLAAANTFDSIAQNNSWGFDTEATELRSYLNANPGLSVTQGLSFFTGVHASSWTNYLDALDTFQEKGVIVWAVSNTLDTVDLSAAMPEFAPDLAEAWVAVVNGYFEVNSNGNINYAELLSASCGMAAAYCIAADGTVVAATATSNSSYDVATGTSFAAPQIAGSFALLAQAFPDLTPEELTNRVLASANNSWFSAEGVAVDGTVNFGGGITHDYSEIWGHGVLDLAAALKPIGTASIVANGNVTTGTRTPLDTAGISVSGAFGDALARGLADRDITVFDYFNGNFTLAADTLVANRGDGNLHRMTDLVRVRPGDLAPAAGSTDGSNAGVVAAAYGENTVAASTVLGLSRNANYVTGGAEGWSTFAYAGGQQAAANAMAGLGVSRTFDTIGGSFTLGISQSVEQGALLGLVGNEAFDFGQGTSITAGHLGYEKTFGDRFAVFANVEVGIANVFGLPSDGLVRSIGPVGFNGFSLGASARGILADSDRLTFTVSRPLTVASGEMELGMPVGRTIDGTITTEAVTLSLTPGGQQLDLGINYEIGIGATSTLRFAATYSLDAGNVDGARGLALAAGLGIGF